MIEIIGYDILNGGRTRQKRFKKRYVANFTELKNEKEKIMKRVQARHESPVEIFLQYKIFEHGGDE